MEWIPFPTLVIIMSFLAVAVESGGKVTEFSPISTKNFKAAIRELTGQEGTKRSKSTVRPNEVVIEGKSGQCHVELTGLTLSKDQVNNGIHKDDQDETQMQDSVKIYGTATMSCPDPTTGLKTCNIHDVSFMSKDALEAMKAKKPVKIKIIEESNEHGNVGNTPSSSFGYTHSNIVYLPNHAAYPPSYTGYPASNSGFDSMSTANEPSNVDPRFRDVLKHKFDKTKSRVTDGIQSTVATGLGAPKLVFGLAQTISGSIDKACQGMQSRITSKQDQLGRSNSQTVQHNDMNSQVYTSLSGTPHGIGYNEPPPAYSFTDHTSQPYGHVPSAPSAPPAHQPSSGRINYPAIDMSPLTLDDDPSTNNHGKNAEPKKEQPSGLMAKVKGRLYPK